jgi:hypothetical protein
VNSIMAAAIAGFADENESELLIQLRDQLTNLRVNAELRDNNSVLLVHPPEPSLPVWVLVGFKGAYYAWQNAEHRHPTSDPAGAARVLVDYIAR